MHFMASLIISGLLMGMPIAFGYDLSAPPANLTGWILFVISLCGLLGFMNTFLTRYILRPIIREELQAVPTRLEFIAHDKKDTEFQKEVEEYMRDGLKLKDRY